MSQIEYDQSARNKLIAGVQKLTDAVKITLGPMGKTVAICRDGKVPHLTKDGVTVANSITLNDEYENAGASLVKEAAQRSAAVAGDGTTSSTVLACEMIQQGDKLIAAGHPVVDVIKGMKLASTKVLEFLRQTKFDITPDRLIDVATISANGDKQIGKIISDALNKVGLDGAISVQEAKGYDTTLTVVDGTYIDRGYENPYFVTDSSKQLVELDNPYILIVNEEINSISFVVPILEKIASSGESLLIICNSISGEALQALVLNRVKVGLKICVIKSPEFASARVVALQDIASLTGSTIITNTTHKLTNDELDKMLGTVKKATVTSKTTLLYGTLQNDEVHEKQNNARSVISDPTSSDDDKKIAERRLRRLSDGISVIQVGGATEAEMKERRDRIDDSLHAAKAALREGVQPGGGVALARARLKLLKSFNAKDTVGASAICFLNSLESPLRQIAQNCGVSADIVLQKVNKMSQSCGYDAKNDKYGDMFELGILDPHAVIVSSIEHSLSVACNLLSIGAIIVQDDPAVGDSCEYFDNV